MDRVLLWVDFPDPVTRAAEKRLYDNNFRSMSETKKKVTYYFQKYIFLCFRALTGLAFFIFLSHSGLKVIIIDYKRSACRSIVLFQVTTIPYMFLHYFKLAAAIYSPVFAFTEKSSKITSASPFGSSQLKMNPPTKGFSNLPVFFVPRRVYTTKKATFLWEGTFDIKSLSEDSFWLWCRWPHAARIL